MPHPKIKPIKEDNPFISFLLYAESGWGKTVFAGTTSRGLILSADPEGVDSAAIQGTNADQWIIRTYADTDEAYRYLRDKGHKEYDWVVVDTLTEIQKIFQRDWLDKNKDRAKNRHPEVLGMDGYQITQNQILAYVKQINDLPMHKLYTTKIIEFEDEEGEIYYLPDLHGQKGDVSRQVIGYMKLAGFGTWANPDDEDDNTRRIYFSNRGAYRGKDRFDAMGRYRDDLTLPALEEIISERRSRAGMGPAKKAGAAKKKAAPKAPPIKKAAASRRKPVAKTR